MGLRAPRFRGRHRATPGQHTTKAQNRRYEGSHRAYEGDRTPPPAQPLPHKGKHRHDPAGWYPTEAQWAKLRRGQTVNGVALAGGPIGQPKARGPQPKPPVRPPTGTTRRRASGNARTNVEARKVGETGSVSGKIAGEGQRHSLWWGAQ